MIHNFELSGKKIKLWQNKGETYEHVLMKALGYAMFAADYPHLEIERRVGLRYKPDLIAIGPDRRFDFWGECGINSLRKTVWLAKHSGARRIALLKINSGAGQLSEQIREVVLPKYREGGRMRLINFGPEIKDLTATRQIAKVSADWFSETVI